MAGDMCRARAALTIGAQISTYVTMLEDEFPTTSRLPHFMSACCLLLPEGYSGTEARPQPPTPSPGSGTKRVPAPRWQHFSRPHGRLRSYGVVRTAVAAIPHCPPATDLILPPQKPLEQYSYTWHWEFSCSSSKSTLLAWAGSAGKALNPKPPPVKVSRGWIWQLVGESEALGRSEDYG